MRKFAFLLSLCTSVLGVTLDTGGLEAEYRKIAKGFRGRIGVCAQTESQRVCLDADGRYSLQSVMKLPVALAVLDAVDQKGWKLDTKILLKRENRGIFYQPLGDLIGPNGYETTLGDMTRRAVVDSDNAAADNLVERLGGISVVQDYFRRKGIQGMRLDRDERTLQTEIIGMKWRPEFVDPKVLDRAIAAVPRAIQAEAYRKYQKDIRDTSSPSAMTDLLLRLWQGKLLSAASTRYILDVMNQTATGTDRLKAGLQPGWKLGHKTGTSGTFEGMAAATNDVGLLYGPKGAVIAIAVFVGDSTESPERRARVMADLARATILHAR